MDTTDFDAERWHRRLERERQARQEAESLLERKSRALYEANQALQNQAQSLEYQVMQRTAELAQALVKAEAATRAKSEFLAMMSHEIRTPMNAILGTAELLALSPLNAEQQAQLSTLRRSGDALLVLINDILDFSKIEAGKLELEMRPFHLREELSSVVDLYRPTARAKGLAMTLSLGPELPQLVQGDSTRLRQIISNLLSNAIKFTAQGQISVQVQSKLVDEDHIQLRVAVQDSGIGILAARRERLFQAFSQVDASTTREYGGTGLGLVISARLCEAMQGGLSVDSQEGQGSTFRFHIRLRLGDAVTPVVTPAPTLSPERLTANANWKPQVLIVDDHVVNRMLAEGMLKTLGIQADQAVNGQEAIACVNRRAYDLILMDMRMPEMDGLDATRVIRKLPLARQPYIVALTANAYESDRIACLEAGMDDFLTKPFRLSDLRGKVAAVRAAWGVESA